MKKNKVIPAPKWLKERMKKLSKLPPPTKEIVEKQFQASIKFFEKM
jgi:hypothetical protein